MKRKLFTSMCLGMALTCMSVIPAMASPLHQGAAVESQTITSADSQNFDGSTAEPRLFGKSKTVKKNYQSIDEIPELIHYEEYINGAWYSGDLNWTGDAIKISGTRLFEATFKGKIYK